MSSIAKRSPLYQEASTQLLRRIANEEWKPGIALPNELELSAEMGVSVGTIRRALDKLEADRMVIRQQGRGTFVTEQATEEFAARFNNVRDANGKPLPVSGNLLSQCREDPTELETFRLNLKPGNRVLRTLRLQTTASHVYMYEQATLSLKHFADIADGAIGNYTLSLLALECGVPLARASERIALCRAANDVAAHLGLEPGSLVLSLDRMVFTTSNEPLEWRVAFCDLKEKFYVVSMP